MRCFGLAWMICFSAAPVFSDTDRFVTSNLLAIFYHELGHAIIDVKSLPVFGQEEDAADVASVLMIDMLYEEDTAVEMAYDTAFGFLADAEESGEDIAWWDVHGPDLQRYYNLVCLFAGADLEGRDDVAEELGLPDERIETCEEEFSIASDSWVPVFDELSVGAPGNSLVYAGPKVTLTGQVISEEVAALNKDFVFPQQIPVRVAPCGEANAFYDPEDSSITMCTELEDWLARAAQIQ